MELAFHRELKWKMGAEEAGRENQAGGNVQPSMRRALASVGFQRPGAMGRTEKSSAPQAEVGAGSGLGREAAICGFPAPLPGRLCAAAQQRLEA